MTLFKTLSAAAEEERVAKSEELDKLTKAVSEAERQTANAQNWISDIRAFLALEKPDRETLAALIEKIEVGENEGTRKEKRQSVKIFYRFVGCVG